MECDVIVEDAKFRELFADALERAVNSKQADHPYYDGSDQGDDDHVTPWVDHPYYDVPGISEAVQCDDDLDPPSHEESPDDAVSDTLGEPAWEEHPYYDTPDEREDNHGSDASDDRDEDQEADPPDDVASDDVVIEEVP